MPDIAVVNGDDHHHAADAVAGGLLPTQKTRLTCRFYEKEFPDIEEVVVAKVHNIGEMGAYARLLEYNDKEGMILMSELSRRRIRSVNKLVRIGRDEYVVVLRADTEKGYIDLSKRRTNQEDYIAAHNRYEKAKSIHSIVKHTAERLGISTNEELESLMQRAVWYFDTKYDSKKDPVKASYNIYRKAVDDASVLDEANLTTKEREELLRNICLKMMPTPDKIRADISVSCTGPAGVEAVKEALRAGIRSAGAKKQRGEGFEHEELKANEVETDQISITLIAPPEYVVTTQSLDKDKGLKLVKNALNAIQEKIGEFEHGSAKVKNEPKVVGQEDDARLKEAMAQAEKQNQQVAGDDDEE
jgi:translation initiation factor 2 subunit 1